MEYQRWWLRPQGTSLACVATMPQPPVPATLSTVRSVATRNACLVSFGDPDDTINKVEAEKKL